MIYIFKITIIWNVSHLNMLIIIIYEQLEHWIMLIYFFYRHVCNLTRQKKKIIFRVLRKK